MRATQQFRRQIHPHRKSSVSRCRKPALRNRKGIDHRTHAMVVEICRRELRKISKEEIEAGERRLLEALFGPPIVLKKD
jgi:hypothetical protein